MNAGNANKSPRHRVKRFVKTPKGQALTGLILLTGLAGLFPGGSTELAHAALAAVTALAADAGVSLALKRPAAISAGGLITGLITADVLSALTPWYVVVLATLVALGSKHLIKRGRKPVFNPAAFGLLFALLVSSGGQSWWAGLTAAPPAYLFVLLGVGSFLAIRVKKYPQVLAFLGTYFGLVFLMAVFHLGLPSATPADALRLPFVNSSLFLAFFMLTDPPTTPASNRRQVQFGLIVAGVAVILFASFGGLAYLLIALLAGNLWTAWVTERSRPVPTPAPRRPLAS